MSCLDGMGKYNEALEIYYQVDKIQTDILGINHPSTLCTKNNIAICLKNRKRRVLFIFSLQLLIISLFILFCYITILHKHL